MMQIRKNLRLVRDERGSAAIEFAISFPIIVLATLMIFDIGRATQMMSTLSNAADDAARYASVHATDSLIPKTETEIIAFTNTRLDGMGAGTAVTVTFTAPAGADPADPDFVSGGLVSVRITQNLTFFSFNIIGGGPQQFIGRADMIVI